MKVKLGGVYVNPQDGKSIITRGLCSTRLSVHSLFKVHFKNIFFKKKFDKINIVIT